MTTCTSKTGPALIGLAALLCCIVLTGGAQEIIVSQPMDSDPGWTTDGEWAFGVPQGGGTYPYDPDAGFTGPTVYGYNLAGDYPNDMDPHYLTTPPFDCSRYERVVVSFMRRLSVEDSWWDEAAFEASNDGVQWTTLWQNEEGVMDDAWTNVLYDISAIADGQATLYLRWRMGPTDSSLTYPGWNIDDMVLRGTKLDNLSIAPSQATHVPVFVNGGATTNSIRYRLVNHGTTDLTWKAASDSPWLTCQPASSTLTPLGAADLDVALSSDIEQFAIGTYTGRVVVLNTHSGKAVERNIVIEVRPDPGQIRVSDTILPADDHALPYGIQIIGTHMTQAITVHNDDTLYDLVLSGVTIHGEYYTDFSDNHAAGWQPDKTSHWSVVRQEYRASTSDDDYMISNYTGDEWSNLSMSTTVHRDGDTFTAASICLRTTPDFDEGTRGSGYVFSISQNGAYCIWKQVDGLFEWIQLWTGSPFIVDTTNRLTASADGGDLQFFINGSRVWNGRDTDLTAGHAGVAGYSGPSSKTTHYFDNVHVTDPVPPGETTAPSQIWCNQRTYRSQTLCRRAPDITLPWESLGPITVRSQMGSIFEIQDIPVFPLVLPPGTSHTFHVTYAPGFAAVNDATFVIESNAADTPDIAIAMSGHGAVDFLSIQPDTDFILEGHPGGPFLPTARTYAVTNRGRTDMVWVVTWNAPWLGVTPTSGVVAPDAAVQVTARTSTQALFLDPGVYQDTILFSNQTTGVTHPRHVSLQIFTSPQISVTPAGLAVTNMQGMACQRTLTLANGGDQALTVRSRTREIGREPTATAESTTMATTTSGRTTIAANATFQTKRLLVRTNPSLSPTAAHAALISLGGTRVLRSYRLVPGLHLVAIKEGTSVATALQTFNASAAIQYAQPDYALHAFQTLPDDPRFSELWGMHNTGQTGGTPDADIDAPEAWSSGVGSSNVVVGIIDTGIDYTHADLTGNLWRNPGELPGNGEDDDGNGYVDDVFGYDFVNLDADPYDDHGHGTHCAGTIAAVGNNAEGVAGVCWQARVMALKFLDEYGYGWTADAISCIEYATLMGAHVLNNSWGGGSYDQALKDAIDAAGAAGILFVAAAGNEYGNDNDSTPSYPASYDSANILSVMATDPNDARASFSNYGALSVDLGAPGTDILSCRNGGGYQTMSGTSMATPHVSGACALLRALNPDLTVDEIKSVLLATVDPTLPGQCVSGGRLNMAAAVAEAFTPWVSVEPRSISNILPATAGELTVRFSAEQMEHGLYRGQVILSCNDVIQPTVTIPVTMTVTPNPLAAGPDSELPFNGSWGGPFTPGHHKLVVKNEGEQPLDWSIPSIPDWFSVSSTSGHLAAAESKLLMVLLTPAAATLPPGAHSQTLVVSNRTQNTWRHCRVSLSITPSPAETLHWFSLDTDPGWTTDPQWQFGEPRGQGSHNTDPSSGFTGTNVYGYNLAGDYSNGMAAAYLTSSALDCSDYRNIHVSFARWLGTEHGAFDRAQFDISTNGTHWTPIWWNAITVADEGWTNVVYDISAVADNAPRVYLRWSMGPTDSTSTYPGWNIDDVRLTGEYIDHFVLAIESDVPGVIPASGSWPRARRASVECTAPSPVTIDDRQYVARGWRGSGSAPTGGTGTATGPFVLSNDASIVWLWATNYWLDVETSGHGTCDLDDGWFPAGTALTATASARAYSAFDGWEGNTTESVIQSNRIWWILSSPQQLVARFEDQVTLHGTPLWWLMEHGLTNQAFEIEAGLDPDGDGALTWQEWWSATIPTNPASALRIRELASGAVRAPLNFAAVPGKRYRVYASPSLRPGDWLPEPVAINATGILSAHPITASDGNTTVYVTATASNRFYRIVCVE